MQLSYIREWQNLNTIRSGRTEIGNAGMTKTQEDLWNEGWIKVMSSSTKVSNFTLELNKNGTRGKFDYQLADNLSRPRNKQY